MDVDPRAALLAVLAGFLAAAIVFSVVSAVGHILIVGIVLAVLTGVAYLVYRRVS